MEAPRYAKSGDVHIAYRAVGEGPIDLVYVPGFVSQIDHWWEEPTAARFFDRLASFSRLVLFDKRGTGLSDPVSGVPTLEERMDDVRAVLDAVGSERAALFGVSEGGPMCCLFAATHPERTTALVTHGALAKGAADEDFPWAPYADVLDRFLAALAYGWGEGVTLPLLAPSMAADERFGAWWARMERLGASPGPMQAALEMAGQIDVRDILPSIRVPTLVLHRTGDRFLDVAAGAYLAAQIPGARFVELPGDDHMPFVGDQDALLDEVEEFLTGVRPRPEPDRVLATVLFTDIVSSTERAAALGDRRWRDTVAAHDALIRRELDRFDGREVKTMGDGFLATFEGPARAIACARSIVTGCAAIGVDVRTGIHTGEIERLGDDVGGMAVNIGARVSALAGTGEVLVSSTVKDLVVGSGIAFEDRGEHPLKGVPGGWRLFAVTG